MLDSLTGCGGTPAWRLRLKAGALALLFAALSVLPWLHVLTAVGHDGHACCAHAERALPRGGSPVLIASDAGASDACWVCQSLLTLLQHSSASGAAPDLWAAEKTAFVARPPQAPVFLFINPATRSQAPPALS